MSIAMEPVSALALSDARAKAAVPTKSPPKRTLTARIDPVLVPEQR